VGAGLIDGFVAALRAAVGLPADPGEPPEIMRLGLYRATVMRCADGSTCDVQPEDKRISPAMGVRLLSPFAGSTCVVVPGSVVHLGWEKGDPKRPYCVPLFESSSQAQSITLTDAAGDSITIGNGQLTVKIAGVQVLQASASSLALGLVGTLPVLVQGAFDSYGVPVTQAPAAIATIVKAG
jgi:hypothetical protein